MKWLLNTTVRLVFLLAFVGIAVLGIPAVSNMYNFAPGAVSNIPMLLDGKTPFGVVKYIPVLLQKLLFSASERIGIPVFGQKFDWVAEANVSLSPGMPIRDGMVMLRVRHIREIPKGSVNSLHNVINAYARTRIAKGDVIKPVHITDETPPPVRRFPRDEHYFMVFDFPRRYIVDLFVGEKVNLTATFVTRDRGARTEETVTIPYNWKIHYIDYDNLEARAKWAVRVYLEMPSRESVTVIRRGAFLLPPYGTLRLTRSSPRE